MRNKRLAQRKIEELENMVRSWDSLNKTVDTPFEKEQIYLNIREKLDELSTIINTEFED